VARLHSAWYANSRSREVMPLTPTFVRWLSAIRARSAPDRSALRRPRRAKSAASYALNSRSHGAETAVIIVTAPGDDASGHITLDTFAAWSPPVDPPPLFRTAPHGRIGDTALCVQTMSSWRMLGVVTHAMQHDRIVTHASGALLTGMGAAISVVRCGRMSSATSSPAGPGTRRCAPAYMLAHAVSRGRLLTTAPLPRDRLGIVGQG